jgi:hypothetical protein
MLFRQLAVGCDGWLLTHHMHHLLIDDWGDDKTWHITQIEMCIILGKMPKIDWKISRVTLTTTKRLSCPRTLYNLSYLYSSLASKVVLIIVMIEIWRPIVEWNWVTCPNSRWSWRTLWTTATPSIKLGHNDKLVIILSTTLVSLAFNRHLNHLPLVY